MSVHYNVPFIENPGDKCVMAVIGMVLAYFYPEQTYSMPELESLCGYVAGKGTWKAQSMLSMAELGLQTKWIEDFDQRAFVKDPEGYLATILDKESLAWQIANSDLAGEAGRVKRYLDQGLPFEQRIGTREDIKQLLDNGWLVMLDVNENPLSGKDGYIGHVVLVTGYDDKTATIHNPDGNHGNKPNQEVTWELLERAWKEFGGSYSLYAFKK